MTKTLKEELEGIAGPGMTDMRRVGKWLELLTAHVAALEIQREQDRNELMSHAGRLAALEAHCGAQLKADHDALAREVNTEVIVGQEMDIQRLRAENAALRERVATLEKNTYLGLCPPEWPTPQPIETAPLGQLMAWDPSRDDDKGIGPAWVHEYAKPGTTVEEWRALLKTWGCTHWLPMPPPPGGGK